MNTSMSPAWRGRWQAGLVTALTAIALVLDGVGLTAVALGHEHGWATAAVVTATGLRIMAEMVVAGARRLTCRGLALLLQQLAWIMDGVAIYVAFVHHPVIAFAAAGLSLALRCTSESLGK
jgi:hypothetical protein